MDNRRPNVASYYYDSDSDHSEEVPYDVRPVPKSYIPSTSTYTEPQGFPEEPVRNQSYGGSRDNLREPLDSYELGMMNHADTSRTSLYQGDSPERYRPPVIHTKADHSSSDNIFQGYEFDDDEDDGFVPFPIAGNSFYPINAYSAPYNPFDSDRIPEDHYEEDDEPAEKEVHDPFAEQEDYLDEYMDLDPVQPQVVSAEPVRTTRQVRMVNGNLILDCPVSDILLSKYQAELTEKDREFLFMRFQACTSEPAGFEAKNFSLRQRFYSRPRTTELMIVVTMYNESEIHLARTLKGIFKNIRYLQSLKHSSVWGPDAWQKIVVCIVSDGRTKINPRARALLAALGLYQDGFAKNQVNEDKVKSHIYEYTTMVGISSIEGDHVKLTTENQVPVQMIFCLKEDNMKKINSHRWAFEAFCPVLKPNVVILLDVGTEPANKSIYRLWKAFKDPRVAGACGEIKVSLGKTKRLLLNPLVAAQNFEYKMSNILDKPMESVFGFITVLPGAFSAYRYVALLGTPLDKYLKGEDLAKSNEDGIFNANMYLAEDRILCFELIAKRGCNWLLKYVSAASASTDVPEELHDFVSQRRRWLNGSFFAAIYSVFHFYKVWKTTHSVFRQFLLHLEFLYQLLSLLVSWFSIGSYFLVFRILTVYLARSEANFAPGNILSVFFLWLYLASIVTTFVLAFGNKPKGTQKFYIVIVTFFAVLMVYMIFAAIYMAIQSIESIYAEHKDDFSFTLVFTETRFRDLVVATGSTYALYLIGSLLYLEPLHMLTCFVQYLLLSPTYINVLNVYAFCNIHDISWGTKGDDKVIDLGIAKKTSSGGELEVDIPTTKAEIDGNYKNNVGVLMQPEAEPDAKINLEEKEQFYYAFIRSMTVLLWMFSNFVIIALVTETGGLYQFTPDDSSDTTFLPSTRTDIFLTVILWLVAFMALFRFVGCVTYLILKFFSGLRDRTRRSSKNVYSV
ncbi:unnamed protein product [Kuraishia capsulata CBS 1993]|uniref:Chitin synthase n=1 Tax=Kuraishia capsulata CBS 1993 TaxID=1382522 RepID=W6MPA2_9ASCO|nr:uncharacterized protein KUCA_T00004454001 [Kuraishia capsulata CBS 1993]CDK28471.1 unnamed protein product [Kuraishia capsulata CBS 1993]